MRFKKGFTLAEVLIVLMIIGVIAVLSVPTMMRQVQEAQLKTGFKKGYNTVVNLVGVLSVEGRLPAVASLDNTEQFAYAFAKSVNVRDYANQVPNSGVIVDRNSFYTALSFSSTSGLPTIGSGTALQFTRTSTFTKASTWITTDDGVSYAFIMGSNCSNKSTINAETVIADARTASCITAIVDANGISKLPNAYDRQGSTASGHISSNATLDTISGDQFHVFVGRDGATVGNKGTIIAARIIGDVK